MAVTIRNIKLFQKVGSFTHFGRRLKSIKAFALSYSDYGDPASVVNINEVSLDPPGKETVLVKMIASPINPADINTIQGVYPFKPTFPAVPGNEGVGEIIEVGEKVKKLKVGDWVIPLGINWGTWRTHAVCPEHELQKIASGLDAVAAATMSVNPCTAYRMLKDFVDLESGDVVIQNGANSACGQSVIQLCKIWGYRTVNIVRNRPDIDALKSNLCELGADYVVTEEELPKLSLFKGELPKPKLGLNCVGGKNCLNMLRHLANGGKLITYGGMSREPVTVPTSTLIFKDISTHGFWLSRWRKENTGLSEYVVMLSEIAAFIKSGQLSPPKHETFPLSKFKEILTQAVDMGGKTGIKPIFDFRQEF